MSRMRLNRINAAAKATVRGKAATVFARQQMEGVTVHIVTTGAYKYGDEWMAEVTLSDGRNVSDMLVDAGLAVYWNGKGPRPADT
jgi:endonuclease YncB( thermonuclease family)